MLSPLATVCGTGNVGIDTICRNLLGVAVAIHIVVVGVNEFPYAPVDGQVAQTSTAIVDVNLAQGLLHRIGCEGRTGDHAEEHDDSEEHTHNASFHAVVPPFR